MPIEGVYSSRGMGELDSGEPQGPSLKENGVGAADKSYRAGRRGCGVGREGLT